VTYKNEFVKFTEKSSNPVANKEEIISLKRSLDPDSENVGVIARLDSKSGAQFGA